MAREIILFLLFFGWGSLGSQTLSQKPKFNGVLVYETYLMLTAADPSDIPENLLGLERLDTMIYYITEDTIVYSEVIDIDGEIRYFTKRTPFTHQVYDYNYKQVEDYSVHSIDHGVKVKYKFVSDAVDYLGLSCKNYKYATNKNDEGIVTIADFPYELARAGKKSRDMLPINPKGLVVDRAIESKFSEKFGWITYKKLLSYSFDEDLNIDWIVELFE